MQGGAFPGWSVARRNMCWAVLTRCDRGYRPEAIRVELGLRASK